MKLYFAIIISISIILLILLSFLETDTAFGKKSKHMIQLCCTWGDALDDGVLTFSIDDGNSDLIKIVKRAINDWEKLLGGVIEFKYIKDDDSESDINIEFKKGKGKKVGKAVTYFDHNGYIQFVELSISKRSYGADLDLQTLEHVIKHEFGHTLGIGHSNFKNSIMYPEVNEIITKISACELDSVRFVNNWKFSDKDNSPHPLDDDRYKCKKK